MAKKRSAVDVYKLWSAASQMEYGPQKVELLARAVQLADTLGDDDLAFDTRMELIDAATFSGDPQVSLVAFSWCLSHADRTNSVNGMLLWKYKWILPAAAYQPSIPRAQVEEMAADMKQRFRAYGVNLKGYWQARSQCAYAFGELKEAERCLRAANRLSSNELTDCEACCVAAQVEFAQHLGQYRRAIEIAGPILRGRLRCAEVPHRTYANLLYPYFALKKDAEAIDCHRRGYRLIRNNPNFLGQVAEHMVFLTLAARRGGQAPGPASAHGPRHDGTARCTPVLAGRRLLHAGVAAGGRQRVASETARPLPCRSAARPGRPRPGSCLASRPCAEAERGRRPPQRQLALHQAAPPDPEPA
ncbi:MAG TPA: hypothetical protein PKD86_04000 [Gemmatales bacterium]|nr:hypothetical protein [Gemmatales bacterium]